MPSLIEDELRRRFECEISPSLFKHAVSTELPVTIFLGAQPGAGKTRAQNVIKQQYRNESLISIVGDDFRQYVPGYDGMIRDHPLNMPDLTAHAAGVWTGMAVEYARDHGFSCIIEGTWRNPHTVLDEAQRAKAAGRRTYGVIVAVPPVLSRLGILERYYYDKLNGGEARWTPPDAHEHTIKALPDNLRTISASPLIDELSVTDRTGDMLYEGHDSGAFVEAWSRACHRTLNKTEITRATESFHSMDISALDADALPVLRAIESELTASRNSSGR